ncbi:hypothetical protein Ae201684P_003303 [Aphanomyces euteiches]|nr:hypothetical protein Ae201684P_003303 [Aphanomyces euteiches]
MYSLASQMVVARPSLVTIPDLYGQGIQMLPAEVFLGSSFGGPFNILRFRHYGNRLKISWKSFTRSNPTQRWNRVSLSHMAMELSFYVKHFDPSTGRTFARGLSWCQPTKAWRAHVARDELLTLQGVDLDMRLGKLPHLTRALIVAGTRAIPMPWTTRPVHDQLWDGQIAVAETQMPGEYRHTVGAPHNLVMMHPATLLLLRDFLA